MAEDSTATSTQTPTRPRRSSFAGDTFASLFGANRQPQPRPAQDSGKDSPPNQYPGPISHAAAQAQQRRLSLTTLGLSGSPSSTSPFNSHRGTRRESISSANSGSIDESAVEEDSARDPASGSQPTTPFARRMSFGAKALRDVRGPNAGGGGGGGSGQNGNQSPPASTATVKPAQAGTSLSARDAKGRGSTEFWNENMRNRAERTSSISGQGSMPVPSNHARAKSVATMEAPVREMPARPKEDRRPDHFQERILKGDFYMD
ncbi:hypothetical protein KC363_g1093 [Hortaea werneckii]|nr:hypothetical protein KC361_g2311 [Hortaea werneckii]KAI6887687.1 hypothetical protein KC325_g1953 [Hortaea werneckii]KAI6998407.1 hypothetical protein KC359_g2434 [Hortaea werneckii]KAI7149169.1 hypothetical protein KC344_g1307 [Hortaea werneckii]KAI7176350.1 hypothetical protein KC360_g3070 [Hortaea werneckii]